ncbi:MAG: hypothetical protein ACHQU1_01230 [Gemmatimonadales bacterium]
MALKRWHQAGIVVAALALAAAVILPPRPMPEAGDKGLSASLMFSLGYYPYQGLHRHADLLAGTASSLRARRTAIQLADSLLAAARGPRAVRNADGSAVVVFEPNLSADSARVWLRMLERELALGPDRHPAAMPVILALRSTPEELHVRAPGVQPLPVWSITRAISWRPERPAVLIMIRIADYGPYVADARGFLQLDTVAGTACTSVLDWGQAFAHFGLPGRGLEKWTGERLQRLYWGYRGSADLSWALTLERRHATHEYLSNLARREEWQNPSADPLAQACVKSGGLQCLKSVGLVIDPSMRYEGYPISLSRRLLLARLMLKDPARFERLWRSDEAPRITLTRVYGQPAEAIVSEWRRSIENMPRGGPRTPGLALLSSLGWAALAVGLGLLMAGRRQVGS